MRIALDAMGGDDAPEPNLDGAIQAIVDHQDLEIDLVGDLAILKPLLAARGFESSRLQIVPAEGWITMAEKPTEALRAKPHCSIAVCWQLMGTRKVDGVVSAGHTGAVVAAGLRTRLFLKNVKRPGIAVAVPTLRGRCVLMDVGANPAARPEHLVQYAVMGAIYARKVMGIESPTVGVMNIGSEDGKGNELVREAHALLSRSKLSARFVGNVEGRDLYQGNIDIIICEGFLGNVILKVSEGMADMMMRAVGHEFMTQFAGQESAVKQVFGRLNQRYQHQEHGGAPLLGVDGICIICHGSSNAKSITNALRVAKEMHLSQMNESIVEELSWIELPAR